MNCFNIILSITCFIMALNADSQPGMTGVSSYAQTMELTDDDVNLDSIATEQLFKCLTPKLLTEINSCEEEAKFRMDNSSISQEESADENEGSFAEEIISIKIMCECTMIRSGAIDETTREFNFKVFSEQNSLPTERKLSFISDTKFCLLADSSESPLSFIVNHIGQESDVTSKNRISVVQSFMCTMVSLLKNGCIDSSLSNSTQTRLINEYMNLENVLRDDQPEHRQSRKVQTNKNPMIPTEVF